MVPRTSLKRGSTVESLLSVPIRTTFHCITSLPLQACSSGAFVNLEDFSQLSPYAISIVVFLLRSSKRSSFVHSLGQLVSDAKTSPHGISQEALHTLLIAASRGYTEAIECIAHHMPVWLGKFNPNCSLLGYFLANNMFIWWGGGGGLGLEAPLQILVPFRLMQNWAGTSEIKRESLCYFVLKMHILLIMIIKWYLHVCIYIVVLNNFSVLKLRV